MGSTGPVDSPSEHDDQSTVLAAFDLHGLGPWLSWRATPHEIAEWHTPRIHPLDPAVWLAHRSDMNPKTASLLVFEQFKGWPEWASLPVPTVEIPTWKNLAAGSGVPVNPRWMRCWAAAGYTPVEYADWTRQGFVSPDELDYWESVTGGNGPATSRKTAWTEQGLAGGLPAGFTGEIPESPPGAELTSRRLGVHDPRIFRQWHDQFYIEYVYASSHPALDFKAAMMFAAHDLPFEWAADVCDTLHRYELVGEVNEHTAPAVIRLWRDRPAIPALLAVHRFRRTWGDIGSALHWSAAGVPVSAARRWQRVPTVAAAADLGVRYAQAMTRHGITIDSPNAVSWIETVWGDGHYDPFGHGIALAALLHDRGAEPAEFWSLTKAIDAAGIADPVG